MSDLVSICIPTYNRRRILPRAVASALGQTYEKLEILISDNASTDNTYEYCCKLISLHPNIKYYRQKYNVGPSLNCDFLVKRASGKYVMILADDDYLEPTAIESMLEIFKSDQKVVHVGCHYRELFPNKEIRCTHCFSDLVDSNSMLKLSSINDYTKNSRLAVLVYGLSLTEAYRSMKLRYFRKTNFQVTSSGLELVILRHFAQDGVIGISPNLLINYTGPGARDGQDSLAAVLARDLTPLDGLFIEIQRFIILFRFNLHDTSTSFLAHSENGLLAKTFSIRIFSRCIFHFARLFGFRGSC